MLVKDFKIMLEGFKDTDKIIITDLKYFYELVELNSDDKNYLTLIIE